MRNILLSLSVTLVVATSSAAAEICPVFLNEGSLMESTHLSFDEGKINVFTIENAGKLNPERKPLDPVAHAQSFLADKEFVTAMVDGLRSDSEFFKTFSLQDMKFILQIFKRYEKADYSDGGRFLTEPEQLTFATVEFGILDDPKRASKAVARIKKIPALVQFSHPERILLPFYTFLVAAGKIEEANRVWDLIPKLNRRSNRQ